ncbi:nucleotidyltransferase family protein [Thioalkalivibrio paradoxus]|uniref:DNA polymerase III subunit beta n=1 Tax=Thioalkalivibrio paradoxus ARh 1 TaxID=713585 RepID=W0DFL4_9GAMM|nr:nucleotidyltransferase domain-containing protein [Thioalkalivibrio paradoxus]AHE97439.1 DNA polymerase III subunit beta [Thioalkalivibrio paradoxus ARh 1]
MRLSPEQQTIIRDEVARAFGPDARVRLFGSRTDDTARGGDIDLYVEADGTPDDLLERELKLHAALQRRLGERRVDLVVHRRGSPPRSIDTHAQRTGLPL